PAPTADSSTRTALPIPRPVLQHDGLSGPMSLRRADSPLPDCKVAGRVADSGVPVLVLSRSRRPVDFRSGRDAPVLLLFPRSVAALSFRDGQRRFPDLSSMR